MKITDAALIASVLVTSVAGAQEPPPRPPGIGTRAELDERDHVETVRTAVREFAQGSAGANRMLGQRFARCVVERNRQASRAIVLQMLDSRTMAHRYGSVLSNRCLGEEPDDQNISIAIPEHIMHILLADALVNQEFAMVGPTNFSAVAPQMRSERVTAATAEQLAAMSERARTARATSDATAATWYVMERLGECVARREAEQVRLLAQTTAESSEERAALQTLQQTLNACVPPGITIRLRAAEIRGAAALAYYRMAYAAPAVAQGNP